MLCQIGTGSTAAWRALPSISHEPVISSNLLMFPEADSKPEATIAGDLLPTPVPMALAHRKERV